MATALYPGAYKPPHRGHFNVVKSLLDGSYNGTVYDITDFKEKATSLLKGRPEGKPSIDKVLIFVGGGERNGIDKQEATKIWEIYAQHLSNVEIIDGQKNPMFAAKDWAKANPDEEFVAVTGLRGEEDFVDLRRVTTFKNTPNVKGLAVTTANDSGVRATNFRKSILSGNLDTIVDFFPKELTKDQILGILSNLKEKIVAEVISNNINGFLSEYFAEDTTPEIEKESALNSKPEYTKYIGSILEYMLDQDMNIQPLPEVKVRYDEENAKDFFGKTAHYDPNSKEIVLYVSGRHPKDICRSFTHEMVHHIQNIENRLGNIQTSDTTADDALLELEKEAYLVGNITFRNWEDSYKNTSEAKKPGLWANINAKKKRGEKPSHGNSKAHKDAEAAGKAMKKEETNETVMAEGKYDKLANKLSGLALETFIDIHDRGDKGGEFEFRVGNPEDPEVDIPSSQFEFDFLGVVEFTEDTYSVDGGANAGFDDDGDEIQPMLNVKFKIQKNPDWQEVSFDLKDVVRHELEHLTQDGENVKPGKYIEDDALVRGMIDLGVMDKDEYYQLPKEVDAMIQGMYFKAKKSRTPFADVVEDYFEKAGVELENRKKIRILWNKRLPKLGIKQRL
jgi:hypothetical protein